MKKKKVTERIKLLLLAIMLVMLLLYVVNRWLLYSKYDKSSPEITFEKELLEVSVSATEEELLADVKAKDKKDGDVTDTIMVESMSKMLEDNQRIVTYAAFDKDNHVGKAERRIRYTDYTGPRFSLEEPLSAKSASAEISEILKPLHASDCIDGDLTNQIVVIDTEMLSMAAESIEMQYEVQVTNSSGDVATVKLPVKVRMDGNGVSSNLASVTLSEYLTYRKVGEPVDLGAFITGVMLDGQPAGGEVVEIGSNLDTSQPGVYTATYTVNSMSGAASTNLIIVVEE